MKTPAILTIAAALAQPLLAQHAPDRHPLYDAAAPTAAQAQKAPAATELKLAVMPDTRISTEMQQVDAAAAPAVRLSGWRGERCSTQLVVQANGAAKSLRVAAAALQGQGGSLPLSATMVRYTKGAGKVLADVIGTESMCDNPAGVLRPVWVQVDIPRDAAPGLYKGTVSVAADGCPAVACAVELEVLPNTLPAPRDWKMHFDLWQQPESVARWHDVPAWSPEHLALMKPLMQRLADAGQKAITCAIMDEAWGGQTYDWFPSQVEWVKGADGQMHYDYAAFDTWVEFMMNEAGMKDADIFCYTMIPWSMSIRYRDETPGATAYGTLKLDHKSPEFRRVWGHFLADFRRHLQEKGWLGRTSIALDERGDELVRAAMAVIREFAPELRVVSSVNRPSEVSKGVYVLSPAMEHVGMLTPELMAERKAQGGKTIYYTCCDPQRPNTFTFSQPAEAEFLPLFAAARHLDGYSRWAYNSWNRNPFENTDFGTWPTGDCFLVYPGNLSSIRFERLRDGIEEYEKIRILRAAAESDPALKPAVQELDNTLLQLMSPQNAAGTAQHEQVRQAKECIEKVSKLQENAFLIN